MEVTIFSLQADVFSTVNVLSYMVFKSSFVAQTLKNPHAMQETPVPSPGWEGPLEKGMATLSSVLAWRIPRAEEAGRLQSMGSHRVRQD